MIQKIQTAQAPRITTGRCQIGDEWPGVFIRGDEVTNYTAPIQTLIKILEGGPLPELGRESYIKELKRRLAALDGYWLS